MNDTAKEISIRVSIFYIEGFYVLMNIDLNFTLHYLMIELTDSYQNGIF